MRIRALAAAIAILVSAPTAAFENELLGKRDIDVPEYLSEQGAILFDDKGEQTQFAV